MTNFKVTDIIIEAELTEIMVVMLDLKTLVMAQIIYIPELQ